MKRFFLLPLVGILTSCSNMTPEQQAQWSATANSVTQQASTILLDEAAIRLRNHKTSDSKDGVK